MLNWHILYSIHWPFHALRSVSWLYGTIIIWAIHRFQTFTHCTRGWAWSLWDYLHCNSCLDFSREFFFNLKEYTIDLVSWIHLSNGTKTIFGRFLVCLCCEKATYGCRGAMVPVSYSPISGRILIYLIMKRNENKIRFSVAGSCKYRFVDVYVGHRHLHQWINRKGHLDITVSLKEKNEILYFNRNVLNYNFPNLINLLHSDDYKNWIEEGIIINALGCVLIALGVLVSFAVRRSNAPATAKVYVTERI